MIREIIEALMLQDSPRRHVVYEHYLAAENKPEKHLMSIVNRVADHFLLTYGDDLEVIKKQHELVVILKKYYSPDPIALTVVCRPRDTERTFEIIDDQQNSIVYTKSSHVEQFIVRYYEE